MAKKDVIQKIEVNCDDLDTKTWLRFIQGVANECNIEKSDKTSFLGCCRRAGVDIVNKETFLRIYYKGE